MKAAAPSGVDLAAIVERVTVSGTVLYDLDERAQQLCGEIDALAGAAIDRLTLDVDSLSRACDLMLTVQAHALRLGAAINCEAEDHGCNHVDLARRSFDDRLAAITARRAALLTVGRFAKGGAA